MTVIRFDELKAIPWKNGLGITREIAVEPAGATTDHFLWRVSIADVDTASPFSRFPGVDRVIVLLEGDGFTMTLDGEREHALTTLCMPFAFAGEAHVDVTLAGGATRDFNLMIRRGKARGSIDVVHGPATVDPCDATLMHIAKGTATVDGQPCKAGDSVIRPQASTLDHGSTALLVRIVTL
jgi:environmental stress-induced protein Ves